MAANFWEILSALGQAATPVKKRQQGMLTPPEMDDEPSNIDIPSIQRYFKQPGGLYENPAAQNLSRSVQSDALDFASPSETSQSDNLNTQMTEGYPSNLAQLYSGAPKKGGFWDSPGGKAVQALISIVGPALLGAGAGALASPSGYKGLGAGRGAALGLKTGFEADVGQRQKSAEQKQKLLESIRSDEEKRKAAEIQYKPTSVEEYEYGLKNPDFFTKQKELLELQNALTPYQQQSLDIRRLLASQKTEGRPLPATQAKILGEAALMPKLLSNLKDSIKEHKGVMGPIQGRLSRMNPWNTEAQVFQGKVDTVRQLVGKFVEEGVLREHDERKYEKILATLANTPETAEGKVEGLMLDLAEKYGTHIESLKNAGFDMSKFPSSLSFESQGKSVV